jgi:hypothetical protein
VRLLMPLIPSRAEVAPDCQLTEVDSLVIDPGLDDGPQATAGGPPKDAPLGCAFPPYRPSDPKARVIAIDDTLGIVVVAMISAFIPKEMAGTD